MGRQCLCPDSDKKKKKDKNSPKRHSTPDGKKDRGGCTHYKERFGQFTAVEMAACIDEIRREEADAKAAGKKPKSRNEMCNDLKLSPSTVSKRMMGKVQGLAPQLGDAWRGRILTPGMFKRHRLLFSSNMDPYMDVFGGFFLKYFYS